MSPEGQQQGATANILVAFGRFSLLLGVRELYGDYKSITSQNTSIRGLVKVLVPFRVL